MHRLSRGLTARKLISLVLLAMLGKYGSAAALEHPQGQATGSVSPSDALLIAQAVLTGDDDDDDDDDSGDDDDDDDEEGD